MNLQAHHHHPRDPEEDDVEAGDQHVGRVVALELRRRFGPAQGRERPERRGEPGVEHVAIARERDRACRNAWAPPPRASASVSSTKTSPSGPYQAGIWWPHQIWREMHQGWMLRIHSKKVFSHILRDEDGAPALDRLDRRLRQRLGVDIPLIGEPGLDHRARAVAMRHHQRMRLDLVDEALRLESRRPRACAPRSGRGRG